MGNKHSNKSLPSNEDNLSDMDVNEERTLDIKASPDADKGDISLVHNALEQSPYVLSGDPAFGLYLTAKRDLPVGQLLFDDVPAFFGPSADLVQDYSTPLCLGCCVVMNDGNEDNRCDTCNWPICGDNCDNVALHRNNECPLFVQNKVEFPPALDIQPCYKAIAIIRGVMIKSRNPQLWQQLLTLQWETQLKLTPTPDIAAIKEAFGLSDFGEDSDWLRILGIINVNSYSFQRVEKKDGSPSFGECLFPIYSLMCHSCTPNCTWAITYSPSFTMKVRPVRDIKKGEMLSVCYNHEYSKFGFYKRQEKIKERAEFICKCERCMDPTDFGVMSAAVTCFKCRTGYMLPEDLEGDWKCDQCGYKMGPEFLGSFVESLYEENDMAEEEAEETGESVVTILEDFIESSKEIKVHPNHWVISEASMAIVRLQMERIPELSGEEVDNFVSVCKYLMKLKDVLAPGFSNERGMLHHYLARGLYRRLQLKIDNGDESLDRDLGELQEIQNYALKFWRENPHYDCLTASYKREPELLQSEAESVSSKLKH